MKTLLVLMIVGTGFLVGQRLAGGSTGIGDLDRAVTALLNFVGIG